MRHGREGHVGAGEGRRKRDTFIAEQEAWVDPSDKSLIERHVYFILLIVGGLYFFDCGRVLLY